jgi:hypothetical protein
METLKEFLERIAAAAKDGGGPPLLIAVSKFQPLDRMLELYRQGQRDFGENYVHELLSKQLAMREHGAGEARFHFIGRLQSNKVKQLLPAVSAIHSVDSVKLLREIDKQANAIRKKIPVFFQVNIDREATKGGFLPEELDTLPSVLQQCASVEASGLMTIPAPGPGTEEAFRKMAGLSRRFSKELGAGLSMGMSSDFEAAIRCGSTHVRIGTALFGARTNSPRRLDMP